MRKWHRWLSLVFGIFMLWIAATGVLSQFASLLAKSEGPPERAAPAAPKQASGITLIPEAQAHEGEEHADKAAPAAGAAAPAEFVCPKGWRCMPPRDENGIRSWVGFFHHLHSGETFGPIGTGISILSGFALLFFAFSGLWLYVQMWRNRKQKGLKEGLFWK